MAKLIPKDKKENAKFIKIKRKYGKTILGISVFLNILMLWIVLHRKV